MAAFTHPAPQSPVLGFGLFADQAPTADALAAALLDEFETGVTVEAQTDRLGRPIQVVVVRTDDVVILVTPVGAPVPAQEVLRACHPLWWDDTDPVARHRAHVIIAATPPDGRPVDRAQALMQASLFSVVASIVMEQPGATALHYGNAGITFPAERYSGLVVDALEGGEAPVDVWTSVWMGRNDDGTVTAWTLGLDTFGHADLTVQGSPLEPEEVFERLVSLAAYIVTTGAVLLPGQSVGYSADQQLPVEASGSQMHPNGALRIVC
ncbi:DUF4261 domain-containing protein [Nigerium massiliense]|uniref:DUF4261 domain-containing protein n=1 Tax=Nigerium massiliense TaxID=1522317 RepID=UPI00058D6208|nr:DUF4261 domain-containing protein [Nigerium massiliense]